MVKSWLILKMNSPYSHKDKLFKFKLEQQNGQVTANKVESNVMLGAQFYSWSRILENNFITV